MAKGVEGARQVDKKTVRGMILQMVHSLTARQKKQREQGSSKGSSVAKARGVKTEKRKEEIVEEDDGEETESSEEESGEDSESSSEEEGSSGEESESEEDEMGILGLRKGLDWREGNHKALLGCLELRYVPASDFCPFEFSTRSASDTDQALPSIRFRRPFDLGMHRQMILGNIIYF